MKDLELGMLVVGGVSLAAAAVLVAATAMHVLRSSASEQRVKVLLAAAQVGLLTPLALLLFSYVYEWADMSAAMYAVTGAAAALASGAGLRALQRNAAR